MDAQKIAHWMISKLTDDECLYQDDVVDFLIKQKEELFLIENSDGNQVLSRPVLNEFRKLTEKNVVWIRSEFYWRWRVPEDEDGRTARG